MFLLRSPDFWYRDPGLLQRILLKPVCSVYRYFLNKNYKSAYFGLPTEGHKIIAVGGLTLGGAGKTVVVQSICDILKNEGRTVAVLSRGYGRKLKEVAQVDVKTHSFLEVGDEPLILAERFPVFVGENRLEISQLAKDFEYQILDDGVTQRWLKPHKKIIVISTSQGMGNGELFPLGPNRLDLSTIKDDIDAFFIVHDGDVSDKIDFSKLPQEIPVFHGNIEHDFSGISGRLIAFCGLGYPQKFFKSFSNFEVAKTYTFPDHYPYEDSDIEKMLTEAFRLGAQLITTRKDLMRIPEKYRSQIRTLNISLKWQNSIKDFLLD